MSNVTESNENGHTEPDYSEVIQHNIIENIMLDVRYAF